MNFGIYIHIPFCQQKCFYCDFASIQANPSIYQSYIDALCQEIALYQELFPDIYIDTIYFGGGTPSILPPLLIKQVLNKLSNSFNLNDNVEITLEANPKTTDKQKLKYLYQNGINRLSFGVQAVQDELLKKIGRIHTIDDANQIISSAKDIGFNNISIDLMYGLPTQTLEMLKQSVAWAIDKDIQHISIYGLQIEEHTVFGKLYNEGKLILPTEETTELMYDYLTETLPKYGYNRYEISNFSKKNYESKHNLAYWQDKFYLGLGAGAHGYYLNKRVQNPFNIKTYIENCNKNILPFENEELLDKNAHIEEFCFLALRTSNGIDKNKFFDTFKLDIDFLYRNKLDKLLAKNLIIETPKQIFLTNKGMKFGNVVFSEFLL